MFQYKKVAYTAAIYDNYKNVTLYVYYLYILTLYNY